MVGYFLVHIKITQSVLRLVWLATFLCTLQLLRGY